MARESKDSGTLYVVATPIGNLRDITLRALDVLRSVDIVAAEDTRHTRKLLSAQDIHKTMISFHAKSTQKQLDRLLSFLSEGQDIAYVTDAGAPGVSDPGSLLVDAAREGGFEVTAIPGASALVVAIATAGLRADDFRFIGFLPRGRGKQHTLLSNALADGYAIALYESPSRIRALLELLSEIAPTRRVALCRELTKLHEEVLRGAPCELLGTLPEKPRGEFTVLIERGVSEQDSSESLTKEELLHRARGLREKGLSTREVSEQLVQLTSMKKKEIYRLIVDDESGV